MYNQSHQYNLRKRPLPATSNLAAFDEIFDFENQGYAHHDDEHHEKLRKRNKSDHGELEKKKFSLTFITVCFLSFVTRFLYINTSPIVVWDEAHFGKFANWYLKRSFYFDVHPPLGKLLIALSGWIFNYTGSFPFESGSTYENVPIMQMRAFCAAFGAMVPIFLYGTSRNLGFTRSTAFLVAIMSICDNAILTISKFVLLDPILLCFTSMSVYCITRFEKESKVPFTKPWYKWLHLTGISLGLVISVKWVGLFTYAYVGLFTIRQLWDLLPVMKAQPRIYAHHFVQRAFHLIVIPVSLYMLIFYVHFSVLTKTGNGDAQMSSRFQANLIGSKILQGPMTVKIEHDLVTLRNQGYGGGILHSHPHAYPTGSNQGQVTLYHHRDNNNFFEIRRPWKYSEEDQPFISQYLKNGDTIRLFHNITKRNLHSHAIPAPLSVYDFEVSTYGNSTIGDPNDHWIIETEKDSVLWIDRLFTTFRLKHAKLGCYLASSGERLPEWGFQQMEVVCTDARESSRTKWNFEEVMGERTEDEKAKDEKLMSKTKKYNGKYFIRDFIDLNVAMWYGNNALTPKTSKKDILVSTPSQWMFLHSGLRMCNWKPDTVKYYLLGNPMVWWITACSVLVYLITVGVHHFKKKIIGFSLHQEDDFINKGLLLLMGWVLHYFPFFLMGRVTYLHHYFPALMNGTLLTGHLFNSWQKYKMCRLTMWMTAAFIMITFAFFSPISYGFVGTPEEAVPNRTWRTWNLM